MKTPDREKVISGLEHCGFTEKRGCDGCPYSDECGDFGRDAGMSSLATDALALLRELEPRVMTLDEWREWKNNPKRNPICELWEHDTSPMWVLNPDTIHEPALLMGKLKLFTGKPTFEQCRAVKWDAAD